ncbi:hypothetical protein NDA01_12945 [Trichocoleus desertorum AS-A10]|uniref:PatU n=1 Tax=Trichocoleus desertorum TaxID=1481672 RepID=UPI003299DB4F
MTKNPESFSEELLAWLLQDSNSAEFSTETGANSINSGNQAQVEPLASSQANPAVNYKSNSPELADLDPLDSEGIDFALTNSSEVPAFSPHSGSQSLKPGEILTVQDRFHALLKRRLQTEIQRHPPLFPWESEVYAYEPDQVDSTVVGQVPRRLWAAQLRNLSVPVALPEAVLAQLLDQCQDLLQTSLREGAKLVRAVETLFPGHTQTLNDLAGMVLVSPARSGTLDAQMGSSLLETSTKFPDSYEAATPKQQMALSLLAAREILSSLTLSISASQSCLERQWLTAAGLLTLEIRYQPQAEPRLRVQGRLPSGGSLKLQGRSTQSAASRSQPGCISVEVFDPQPNQTYPLTVEFYDQEQEPLVFVIQPLSD